MKVAEKMALRQSATQATIDHFRDLPFQLGVADCAKMTIFHLKQFGIRFKLSKVGPYSTPIGARRAVRRLGFDTLAEALDDVGLQRIAPAEALIGDILELEADAPPGALHIAVGNGRTFAYHEDAATAVVMQPLRALAAWRVLL